MADPRLDVVMDHLFTCGAFDRTNIGIPMARMRAWMILDALDGQAARALDAASASAAPVGETVEVRVAVAIDENGNWKAFGRKHCGDKGLMAFARQFFAEGKPAAILTARVPLPTVPEVPAGVEGV